MHLDLKTCLIVEDQKASVEFIKKLMRAAFPKAPIETARDLKEAESWLNKRAIQKNKEPLGLVFVDLGLPDGNGVEVIQSIARLESEAIPIVVTIYDDDAFLFKALAAGAKGYLLKGDDPEILVETLKRIRRDDPPLSPAIARKLLSFFKENKACEKKDEAKLTPREHETLILLARGLTIPETAKQLGLSAQTVTGYVKIIYQKLHVSNRIELVQEASRRNLI